MAHRERKEREAAAAQGGGGVAQPLGPAPFRPHQLLAGLGWTGYMHAYKCKRVRLPQNKPAAGSYREDHAVDGVHEPVQLVIGRVEPAHQSGMPGSGHAAGGRVRDTCERTKKQNSGRAFMPQPTAVLGMRCANTLAVWQLCLPQAKQEEEAQSS